MSLHRAIQILRKDLKLGPRSPVFLYAVVFPVVGTLLVQVVFGGLFDPDPRLGIADEGESQITSAAVELAGIQVALLGSAAELKEQVRDNNLDVGLVLQEDFDEAVRRGEMPVLQLYIGGQSLASNRYILAITLIDLVRDVVGDPAPVQVEVVSIGDAEPIPVADRLIPMLVMFAVLVAGLFVPAAGIVDEKEKGTLSAVLITPTRVSEVLAAKGVMALVLALGAGLVTLALNQALTQEPLVLVSIIVVAALQTLLIGLIVGCLARDVTALYTVVKGGSVLLFAPVIFFVWPDLPLWIAKLFPTYYFLNPVYQVAVRGAELADVSEELVVALAICLLLVPFVALAGRRMAAHLATS